MFKKVKPHICTNCGTVVTEPKTNTKGYFVLEIILWLCYVIPGVIYTTWRLTTRSKICHSCGSANLVELDSPVGKRLQNEFK